MDQNQTDLEKKREWRRKYMAEYRRNNKEKIATYSKNYLEKNKDLILQKKRNYSKIFYEKNKDAVKKRQSEYREKNREKLKLKYSNYYNENRLEIVGKRRVKGYICTNEMKAYLIKYRMENPERSVKSWLNHKLKKLGADSNLIPKDLIDVIVLNRQLKRMIRDE